MVVQDHQPAFSQKITIQTKYWRLSFVIYNINNKGGPGGKVSILTQIKVLVTDEYIGHSVACTNEFGTQLKNVDSSLLVTFDVELGEWQIILDDLEEVVNVCYYGLYTVDFTEPESVALMGKHTSATGGTGTLSSSSVFNTDFSAYKALDGLLGTEYAWASANGLPQWWRYKFNEPKVVKKIAIWISYGAPKLFHFQGSNDGNEWVNLGTFTNSITVMGQKIEYSIKNKTRYPYYRLYFVESFSSYVETAEIQFYGY